MLEYKHLNVYWFTEMESELLFIGLQKWDQSFCLLAYKWDQSFCLLVHRNWIRDFAYWFTEMR